MVDHDTNSTQCSRSCSCSYTSLIYSELLTDEEIPPILTPNPQLSEPKGSIQSPKCTCPPLPRPKLAPVVSDVRALPLSTTTCLPLPLPPTPIAYYREPDYLRMERNFFSGFDGRPFVPLEPQRVCYMTRSPKNIGELFTAQYNRVWHLVKNDLQRAEYVKPSDPEQTPFQSVVYMKGERKGESIPVMKEVAQVVNLKKTPEVVPEEPVRKCAQPAASVTPHKECSLVESISNDCSSIYRAMGSTTTSRSSQGPKTASSKSIQSAHGGSDDSADELVRLWNEFYGDEAINTKQSTSEKAEKSKNKKKKKKKPSKESSSWEKTLSEDGARRSSSDEYFPPGTKKYLTLEEVRFMEWEKEIGRLKEFLGEKESAEKKGQKAAGGEQIKIKKRKHRKKK